MGKSKTTVLLQEAVCRGGKLLTQKESSIQLAHPFNSACPALYDRRMEALLQGLTRKASLQVIPGETIRIAVRERTKMRDLEKFFQIRPSYWIQLRMAWCGPDGFEKNARELMLNLGYRCEEWIGAGGSWPQLGAFSFGSKRLVKFLFWIQRQKNLQKCELLIPVMEHEQPPGK